MFDSEERSKFFRKVGGLNQTTQHYIPEDSTVLWEPQIQHSSDLICV
jgi:hypothetical protein